MEMGNKQIKKKKNQLLTAVGVADGWWFASVRVQRILETCSVWFNCEQGMDFSGPVMGGTGCKGKDDLARDESRAPVMDANWGVIIADTEISPISTGGLYMKTA